MQTTTRAKPGRRLIRIPIWLGLCLFLALLMHRGRDGHAGSGSGPNPIHIASGLVIAAGFILLSRAWRVRREEREVRVGVGPAWDEHAARTPAFLPHLWRRDRIQEPARGG